VLVNNAMQSSPHINTSSSYLSSDSSHSHLDFDPLSPLSETHHPGEIINPHAADGYISSPSLSKSETQDSLQWKFGPSPRKVATKLFSHPEEDSMTATTTEQEEKLISLPLTICAKVPSPQMRASMRNAESKISKMTSLLESSGLLEMALQATSFEYYQKVPLISLSLSLR
jgi:hypothetical protein